MPFTEELPKTAKKIGTMGSRTVIDNKPQKFRQIAEKVELEKTVQSLASKLSETQKQLEMVEQVAARKLAAKIRAREQVLKFTEARLRTELDNQRRRISIIEGERKRFSLNSNRTTARLETLVAEKTW